MGASSEEQPIFVVGTGRSGTTLVRSILSAHPRIAIAPEAQFFFRWYPQFRRVDLNDPAKFDAFWREFIADRRFPYLQVGPDALRSRIEAADSVDMKTVFTSVIRQFADDRGKPRWGEKMPGNYKFLDVLFDWFPGARVLFTLRDPRAVVASMLRVEWALPEPRLQARKWVGCIDILGRWASDPRVRVVRYESLVTDPEPEVRGWCEFLGEAFTPEMLGRRDSSIPLDRRTGWAREHLTKAMKPVDPSTLEKWKRNLTPLELNIVEHIAGDAMERHGYERVGRPLGSTDYVRWAWRWAKLLPRRVVRRVRLILGHDRRVHISVPGARREDDTER